MNTRGEVLSGNYGVLTRIPLKADLPTGLLSPWLVWDGSHSEVK